jgi:hypothetical protein
MPLFQKSSCYNELTKFVDILGMSLKETPVRATVGKDDLIAESRLSVSTVCLIACLDTIAATYISLNQPDKTLKCRFGNPVYKTWHSELTAAAPSIITAVLSCVANVTSVTREEAHARGVAAADGSLDVDALILPQSLRDVVPELATYFTSSFGHPIRIDYGTGHESSFIVFLMSLVKCGMVDESVTMIQGLSNVHKPSLATTIATVMHSYLQVTRGIQSEYMLEPAGSHGVWGLDDYHCLPFYFGSCQIIGLIDHGSGNDSTGLELPTSIHNEAVLEEGDGLLYISCIKYIKFLKHTAPFAETSPMLNDISYLPTWNKVASGLNKLYLGEVLSKFPVVQHFVFGSLFQADWVSVGQPRPVAPASTFINQDECVAPWAQQGGRNAGPDGLPAMPPAGGYPGGMPPTKAPWAK